MTRSILTTTYTDLAVETSTEEVIEQYKAYYQGHPFVRIREAGQIPSTKEVYGSNFCDIWIYVDDRTNKLIIVSVIDNLVKGASCQAIQNLNLMAGRSEERRVGKECVFCGET